jgi:hypothetical protein
VRACSCISLVPRVALHISSPSHPNNHLTRANVAKYRAHAHLQRDLLSTGCAVINGAMSTSWACAGKMHNWSVWNGLIQVRASAGADW